MIAEKRGRQQIYGVRREGLAEMRKWLDGFWDEALARYNGDAVIRCSGESQSGTGHDILTGTATGGDAPVRCRSERARTSTSCASS